MNKDKLLVLLQKNSLSYKSRLNEFFMEYIGYLESLYVYALDSNCPDKEKYIIKRLENWMYDEGYQILVNTVEQLDDDAEAKIIKFIELYEFFLSCSTDSVEKLVDHLFYIPGQFLSQFMSENRSLVGTIEENKLFDFCSVITNYTVIRKGVFQEIPFFCRWRVC